MFVEIDSSDIIAFLINDSGFCDDFEIPFSRVIHLAKIIESENEDILTFCDSVSIDAFRCAFSSNVVIEHSIIRISNVQNIRPNIERLLPSQRIMDLLEDIIKR